MLRAITTWAGVLLFFSLGLRSSAAQTNTLAGDWVGGFDNGEHWIHIQAHFKTEGTNISGTFDRPLESVFGTRLREVAFESPRIQFQVVKPERLRFEAKLGDGVLEGMVEVGQKTKRFHLTRVMNLDVARFVGIYRLGKDRIITMRPFHELGMNGLALIDFKTAESRVLFPLDEQSFFCGPKLLVTHPINGAFRFSGDGSGPMQLTWKRAGSALLRGTRASFGQEQMAFTNGATRLNGTLSFPDTKGPHPAIVFIHGSGPGDRDQLRFIADYFLVNGFATFVYDKRSNWLDSSFSDLADDALAGLRGLKSRSDIQQVGLWGVSQGGWLVAIAASRSSDVAFIINESGPGMTPEEQMQFTVRTKLQAARFDAAAMLAASNLVRKNFDSVRTGSGWDALAKANDAARHELWFPHMASLEMHRDDPAFWRLNAFFDPVPALRQVRCPVLAIYGERDTLVSARQSADIWRTTLKQSGNTDVTVKIFSAGDHGLRETTGGTLNDVPTSRGFVSGYFETQRSWALKRVSAMSK